MSCDSLVAFIVNHNNTQPAARRIQKDPGHDIPIQITVFYGLVWASF